MKLSIFVLSALAFSMSATSAPFQATIGGVQVTEGDRAVILEAQQYGLDRQQKLPINTDAINSAPVSKSIIDDVPVNSLPLDPTEVITSDNLNSFDAE